MKFMYSSQKLVIETWQIRVHGCQNFGGRGKAFKDAFCGHYISDFRLINFSALFCTSPSSPFTSWARFLDFDRTPQVQLSRNRQRIQLH